MRENRTRTNEGGSVISFIVIGAVLVAVVVGGIYLVQKRGENSQPSPGPVASSPAPTNYGGQRVEAIVVGMPGTVVDGVAIWCGNLGWKNFNIASSLEGILGKAPIFVENDANLAGLAETRSREPMPKSSLYVTISTGIGTGITTDGVIDPGVRLSEGGHMLVEYDGKVRQWETFASGKAIHDTYKLLASDIHDKKSWDEIADKISRGFLAAIPLLQPEVIIIGGSIGTYFDQFAPQLNDALTRHLPEHIPCPNLQPAKHPEQAVIYGCYYYAIDQLID